MVRLAGAGHIVSPRAQSASMIPDRSKNCGDVMIRLETVSALDGRTDGRRELEMHYRAVHALHAGGR